jgi:2,3-bisphosphoglycerate-independent phosphoglycerate mutase
VGRADASGGLADALEAYGLRSVRIAEKEKFEHVTYYINGRQDRVRDVEEHVLVPSPLAPDYRARPQMNLEAVTDAIVAAGQRADVDLVVANLANIDVVGHTGDEAATVLAAEHTDKAVARITEQASATGRWVLLVGDHGNAERMTKPGPDGAARPYGGHTTNPVPAIIVPAPGQDLAADLPEGRTLADIAPTVLALLGHAPAPTMTGRSDLQELLHVLELALLGTEDTHTNGALANPRTASAFAPGSTFQPVDLGRGLWAVSRTSQDGANRVLCVHNISDKPLTFAPDEHLGSADTPLVFLRGATFADEEQGTTVCRIDAHAHAWLGRFPDPTDDPNGDSS